MKKQVLSIALFLLSLTFVNAQNPEHSTLDYLKTIETFQSNDILINAIDNVVDSNGNMIVVGLFKGRIDVDPSSSVLYLDNLDAGQEKNLFMAKYDPSGLLLWGFEIGDGSEVTVSKLTIDANDDLVVSGTYSEITQSFDVDPGPNTENLVGKDRGFIVKYDNDGNYLWKNYLSAVGSSGYSGIVMRDHVLQSNGNVTVVGDFTQFFNMFDANNNVINFQSQSNGFGWNVFMAELNTSGEWIDATHIPSQYDIGAYRFQLDSLDNPFVLLELKNATSYSYVLRKYSNATLAGFQDIISLSPQSTGDTVRFSDVKISSNNDVYVIGDFRGNVIKNGVVYLDSASNMTNGFILKFDSTNTITWLEEFEGTEPGILRPQKIDLAPGSGEIFISGWINGEYEFDGNGDPSIFLENRNTTAFNSFLMKYNSDTTVSWGYVFDSLARNYVASTSFYNNDFFIFGDFNNTTYFNMDPNINNPVGVAGSSRDFFLGGYEDNIELAPRLSNTSFFNFKGLNREKEISAWNDNNILHIYLEERSTENLSIDIYSMKGQKLNSQKLEILEGETDFQIDLSYFSTGIYLLRVADQSDKFIHFKRISVY